MELTDVFPQIPKVARLLVTEPDATGQSPDFWIWFRSFQGLVNREEPHLYIMRQAPADGSKRRSVYEDHWLDYYTRTFGLPVESENGIDALLDRYRRVVDGYVVYDPETVIQTQNLAITRCGLESVLPVAPDQIPWMERHGIQKRDDLRGRWSDDWDVAEWMLDNLWPKCYRRIYGNFCIHRAGTGWYAQAHDLEDFIVRHKGMAIDLPRVRALRRSLNLARRMYEEGEAPGAQMNWHCIWEQEKEYVVEAAKRGYYTLCSVGTPNLTIHGGVGDPDKGYTQPLPDPATCRAEKGKAYVCFYNSDGDATWAMNNLHSGNWLVPQRGKFKFGWGFLPLMVKLMPGMLQYYHETKSPKDCFFGPSSGAAYTYSWAWPDDLVELYLKESRQLLDQSGQNGVNMVNWFLEDWWREVEDDGAIRREQDILGTGNGVGLVCGLGGSPWAKSYPQGRIPKTHSVHIANVGRDNVGDIVRLTKECPTRPLFLFLFAQISVGIWEQLEKEMPILDAHPEIELLSMDEFFLTLQDAVKKGLVKDELYPDKTPELAETWLKKPGRHRLPIAEKLAEELVHVARAPSATRRQHIADAGWTDLVSIEVEGVAGDREKFLAHFKGRTPPTVAEEADAFLYVAFTAAWVVIRAAIEAQGVYANHRTQCLDDFRRTCASIADTAPFEKLFDAWEKWDEGAPSVADIAGWCEGVLVGARKLRDALGPDESEAAFTGWPPRTI